MKLFHPSAMAGECSSVRSNACNGLGLRRARTLSTTAASDGVVRADGSTYGRRMAAGGDAESFRIGACEMGWPFRAAVR